MLFLTLFVCLEKVLVPFLPFLPTFSMKAPSILHALPTSSQTVFDFLSQRHNKLCHFISDTVMALWHYGLFFGWRNQKLTG